MLPIQVPILSIIDSDSGNVTNIHVGTFPTTIAISPTTNNIYVVNYLSDSLSVINGFTDRQIANISVGKLPMDILIASSFGPKVIPEKIYVDNSGSDTTSVINASSNKIIRNIPAVGGDMASTLTHSGRSGAFYYPEKIYVANYRSGAVSVINASNDNVTNTIPVGHTLSDIAVNPSTNKIYVDNSDSNTISVINASSDKVITNVTVGRYPSGIAVNPSTNKIYVANSDSNTISVINASSDKVITNVTVGRSPDEIAGSYLHPSIMYVLNTPNTVSVVGLLSQHTKPVQHSTVSVIDGSVDKVAAGVRFNIHPANSGGIWCNNKEYPTNTYLYVANDTKCIARPAMGFEFSSWAENLPHNSTIPLNQSAISDSPWNLFLGIFAMKPNDSSATFDVNRFGSFTANFKAVPPPVPPEYWIPLYGIIVSTIVGWSIPSIIGWIKSKTQIRRANQYHKRIHPLYTEENDKTLDALKTDIKNAYAGGKISEQAYNNLKDETSILYERAYKNRIDSLSVENDRIELDEIKNDVTDAYAEGKITEQHYNLLKEKIANFSENSTA